MREEYKGIVEEIKIALVEVKEVIKEDIAKYEYHIVKKEKFEEIVGVVGKLKIITDKLELRSDALERLYAMLLELLEEYDICRISGMIEGEVLVCLEEACKEFDSMLGKDMYNCKRTINVKYVDFYPEFIPEEHWLYKLLSKKYNVIFSDKPDYLFFSCFGNRYLQYSCIRIFISDEAVYPNFNLCDYAVTYADFEVSDRLLPNRDAFENLKYKQLAKSRNEAEEILRSKTEFCNFVYSNGNGDPYRAELFYALNKYQQVLSGGKYLNNIGRRVEDICTFQSEFKFSIACENSFYKGYTTEKIINALNAKTIPIYWGNEDVSGIINSKAIINCHEYESLAAVVDEVARLNEDDEAYMEKLMQPLLKSFDMPEKYLKEREEFIYNIIEQPYAKAFRRNRGLRGQWYNDWFCYLLGYENEWFSEEKDYFIKKKQ